ncbi:signal peptidase I [Corynebacterium sp.]|uniref:signal peptidase I n=1 Tax=Corynebacterium sp. TaxID=1720 RepID=UPI0026DC5B18|nr:signal peptidase I [Corynebacterium sp.]MDO5032521.1 signal peptidase I [Corynebacterium sp.]
MSVGKTASAAVRNLVEWVLVFVIALAFFLFIRAFVVTPYTVPTGSMEPTIQIGDNLFAEKLTLRFGGEAEAGDIVVFDNPDGSSGHDILVKRVIATAGQTVDLRGGAVYVDDVRLDEPYTAGRSYPLDMQAPGAAVSFPYTVPEGHVWVMGDNRENSADSRYFGAVPCDNLIGIAIARYWPLSRIGLLS